MNTLLEWNRGEQSSFDSSWAKMFFLRFRDMDGVMVQNHVCQKIRIGWGVYNCRITSIPYIDYFWCIPGFIGFSVIKPEEGIFRVHFQIFSSQGRPFRVKWRVFRLFFGNFRFSPIKLKVYLRRKIRPFSAVNMRFRFELGFNEFYEYFRF